MRILHEWSRAEVIIRILSNFEVGTIQLVPHDEYQFLFAKEGNYGLFLIWNKNGVGELDHEAYKIICEEAKKAKLARHVTVYAAYQVLHSKNVQFHKLTVEREGIGVSQEVQQKFMRMPDDENGGFVTFPACLINENLAFVIFDEHLEVHMVEPTDDPNEYDLRYASNPMFFVGDNYEEVIDDLQKMNLVEFAKKYTHSDFYIPDDIL